MPKAIFEIFKTGKHYGIKGKKPTFTTWTEKQVKDIADLYNEQIKSAPLVIGHPEDDKPEYGKVKKLIYCQNALFTEAEVQPSFIKEIKAGRFKAISSAFYGKKQEENPLKGVVTYLKHVGFLEANQSPAVKGMLPPEMSVYSLCFSEQGSDVYMFCESDYIELDYPERLHKKTLYFQEVLGVDYKTALQYSMNKD
ncbi:hypothetical protein [Pasteurella atlantica]|uniref:hypothetical protein n=1 Tax=Pasteurellaceae TaxID=712 RepID=UPI00275DC793|nr:hypothetical protein [Pasteurella atlantica]MDP8098534.1 hypothetical protein [Pasteurella atlantica]MDP8106774.1 hypothetical protein [Pasteurella atlantica]MDP8116465.1 hypothetical protein [Pasteurella atlantica]